MKNAVPRLIASLSTAAIALSATPAFAYIPTLEDLRPDNAERVNTLIVPNFSPFHEDPGSAFRKNRRITSRAIRGDRNQNRPDAGNIRVYGMERREAQENKSGRDYLPVRGVWQHPGLRNRNRHVLGWKRGGHWNRVDYTSQGDVRRRPVGLRSGNYSFPSRLNPTLRSTKVTPDSAKNFYYPNWRRWARGSRDLNNFNRPNIGE